MNSFGVRRLDAALLSITPDRYQSGVKPPHSRATTNRSLYEYTVAGLELWRADAAEASGCDGDRRHHARVGHWRKHRDLQRRECSVAQPASVPRTRSARVAMGEHACARSL